MLETPHFTIYYYIPLGRLARRVAVLAERAHSSLSTILGYEAGRRTHVVLTDQSEAANGSATSLPVNTIELFATAPEALSELGATDDWMGMLVAHEHTHIVHLDQWGGVASFLNLLFGKVYTPNIIQPRWLLEGVATWQETEQSSVGGRIRSSIFRMYLRMDALEDRLWSMDQLSTTADRWPHGTAWYLYGSFFVDYLVRRFGREAIAELARRYGRAAIPYGVNREFKAVSGHTLDALYSEFLESLKTRSRDERARIWARGAIEGERITFHGEVARTPRFANNGQLFYYRADNRTRPRYVAMDPARPEHIETWARARGAFGAALHPDGDHLYYARNDNHRDIYFFNDLFRRNLKTGRVDRLTHGLRAREPDISPDGRKVAFTVNGGGTTHLMVASLGNISQSARRVLTNPPGGQVYQPRFSPDGRTLAFSRFSHGGYRDIQLLRLATGEVTDITRDRAMDTAPCWSADGRTLYFSSDRSGIANIYRYDLDTGQTHQVTRVVAGAYQPAVSPDGRLLVYVGYTSYGWDLFRLNLHPDAQTAPEAEATPYEDTGAQPADDGTTLYAGLSRAYNPLETLWPRSYLLNLGPDAFGPALGVDVAGRDFAGRHEWSVAATTGFTRGNIDFDIDYAFRRLPATFRAFVFRELRPRRGLFVNETERGWTENALGASLAVSYTIPSSFYSHTLGLSYGVTWLDLVDVEFEGQLDPNTNPPFVPNTGTRANLAVSWSYSDVERYLYDISSSNGRALALRASFNDPSLGSQFRALQFEWGVRQYLPLPWLQHHVLALQYTGGISVAEGAPGASFAVGGFGERNLLTDALNNARLGGTALRGYAPFARVGSQFHLAQVEYRFPIFRLNQGVSTLPFYLNRLYAIAFFDVGDAFFGDFDLDALRAGAGAELFLDLTVAYTLVYTVRLGYARGFMQGGGDQVYLNFGVPF